MTTEKLTELVVAESDANKAKALAEITTAQQKAEADLERARLENEATLEKVKADRERAQLEREAAAEKAKVDREKIEAETKIAKKDRILGVFKLIGTILLGVFTGWVTLFGQGRVIDFERTGTIRSKGWLGVKPDKTPEIR